jgi:hypothetical protein
MDPVALKIQALIPKATRAGVLNNWDSPSPYTDEVIPSIKIDEHLPKGRCRFLLKYFGPHQHPDGLPSPLTQNDISRLHPYRGLTSRAVTPTLMIHGVLVSCAT